ncbi:MAG: hypothetical protein IT515_00930 [Burkholderiales bacterium]|nr:hypothetical protein [Burkholderiales bacterium]
MRKHLVRVVPGLAAPLPLRSPLRATVAAAVALAVYAGVNVGVWQTAHIALPLASSLLVTLAMFALNMPFGHFVASCSRRQFTERSGQYVPPERVDRMARDPKELSQLLSEHPTETSRVIAAHRGTLDEYSGDAIMALEEH